MGHPQRVDDVGAVHHVMNRGTAQTALFRSDADRLDFVGLLRELEPRFELEVHALVLMTNHYHLLLRSGSGRLSEAMKWFESLYVRRFNHRHDRIGSLCQGRFKSRLVDHDAYVDQVVRYIHLNPVEAGLAERAIDYRWSSMPHYAGLKRCPTWLHTDLVLSGRSARQYVADVERADPADASTVVALPVRTDPSTLPASVAEHRLDVVDGLVGRAFGVSVDEIHRPAKGRPNPARQAAMALSADLPGVELAVIARRYGVSGPGSIRNARSKTARTADADPRLRARLEAVRMSADYTRLVSDTSASRRVGGW